MVDRRIDDFVELIECVVGHPVFGSQVALAPNVLEVSLRYDRTFAGIRHVAHASCDFLRSLPEETPLYDVQSYNIYCVLLGVDQIVAKPSEDSLEFSIRDALFPFSVLSHSFAQLFCDLSRYLVWVSSWRGATRTRRNTGADCLTRDPCDHLI